MLSRSKLALFGAISLAATLSGFLPAMTYAQEHTQANLPPLEVEKSKPASYRGWVRVGVANNVAMFVNDRSISQEAQPGGVGYRGFIGRVDVPAEGARVQIRVGVHCPSRAYSVLQQSIFDLDSGQLLEFQNYTSTADAVKTAESGTLIGRAVDHVCHYSGDPNSGDDGRML